MSYTLANDRAAILRARWISEEDDLIQVWRGMECIYLDYYSANSVAV